MIRRIMLFRLILVFDGLGWLGCIVLIFLPTLCFDRPGFPLLLSIWMYLTLFLLYMVTSGLKLIAVLSIFIFSTQYVKLILWYYLTRQLQHISKPPVINLRLVLCHSVSS